MMRYRVLIRLRTRMGNALRQTEKWVEADGATGQQAMDVAREAHTAPGVIVSVHNCVPLVVVAEPKWIEDLYTPPPAVVEGSVVDADTGPGDLPPVEKPRRGRPPKVTQ